MHTLIICLHTSTTAPSPHTYPTLPPPHLNAGVMVGIDICYNLHSAFGNWFPGSKTLILQVYGEVWV